MVERRGTKRTYISISSSSSGDDEEEPSEEDSDSEEHDGNEDDKAEDVSASTSFDSDDDDDDDDDDDEEEEEEEEEESGSEWSDDKCDESGDQEDEVSSDLDEDESGCNRVIRLLREKSDLQKLNLKDFKSYLRQHGLRITGTKAECIQRIMEHWRIKDENVETLYPKSSFAINCTGDVCKGDAVLFTQKVYKKFDKMKRQGSFIGKRTIAGRVVKESYGAAKQQHTFTIEVLWSKGIEKLPPLFPLLVKGRNLYRLKTFRQPWKCEAERLKVLAEKHKRGAAARLLRAMNKTQKAYSKNRGNGKRKREKGAKRRKHFHRARPSQMEKKVEPEKGKHGVCSGKAAMGRIRSKNHRQEGSPFGRANLKKNLKSKAPKSSRKHQNHTQPLKGGVPTTKSYTCPPQNFHQSHMQFHHQQQGAPFRFPCYEAGCSSSTTRSHHFRPYMDSSVVPLLQRQGTYRGSYPLHDYSHPSHVFEARYVNPAGSISKTTRFSHFRPQVDSSVMPTAQRHGVNHVSYPHHAYSLRSREFKPRHLNPSSELINTNGLSKPFSFVTEMYEQRRKGF